MGDLTEALGASQQNVSKHLSSLLAEGFVARRKQGTSSLYRIADPGVHEICERLSAPASRRSWSSSKRYSPTELEPPEPV